MTSCLESSTKEPGFCPDCGCILPLLTDTLKVECFSCRHVFGTEVYGNLESHYVIHFNTYSKSKKKREKGGGEDGPVVDRVCPKCKNDKMSYATLQLRSADEGQTVFYTCTNCKYKETENS